MKISKNIIVLFASNLILIFMLLVILFQIFPENSNYYLCNNFVYLEIFSFEFSFPNSCDSEIYLIGVDNFSSISTFDYNYQTRPVYILSIKFIKYFLGFFLNDIFLLNFFSFTIFHYLILNFSIMIIFNILNIQKKLYLILSVSILVLLNPILKWGIFDAAHQTLTLPAFSLSMYFLTKEIDEQRRYYYSFFLGIMILTNMTFGLTFMFMLFGYFKSSKNIKITMKKNILSIMYFLLPYLSWNFYITFLGYKPYNAAINYWYQFKWIPAYFVNGYENINFSINLEDYDKSEFYCMSLPENFVCYFKDFANTIEYLLLPTLLILFVIAFKKNFINSLTTLNYFYPLLIVFCTNFLFWSLIGWYPPLRMNLYSYGYLITFLLIIIYLKLGKFEKFIYMFVNILYLVSLNHWNNPNVVSKNLGILVSYIIFFLFLMYSFNQLKIKRF